MPLTAEAEFASGEAESSSSNRGGCAVGSSSDCADGDDDDEALYGLLIIGTCFDLEKPAENCGADSDDGSGSVFVRSSFFASPLGRRFLYTHYGV